MDALSCPVCFELYNMEDHRPKTFRCKDSVCLSCLQTMYQSQGRLVCPICLAWCFESLEDIPDDQSIMDILAASGMRGAR